MSEDQMVAAKKTSMNEIFYCAVEGNIGAGKTTFLREVIQRLHMDIVFEPVKAWQHVGDGQNMLAEFYKDPHRWSYTFQSYAAVTRVLGQQEKSEINKPLCITERSIFSDRYCFAKNCFEQGFMSLLEWHMYQELFSWLVGVDNARPHGFIYLRVDPQICYDRLRKRNRDEEAAVSLEYLESIHQQHEDWLVGRKGLEPNVPILVLDCSEEFQDNEAEIQKFMSVVKKFCEQISLQTLQ